mmetsp:Transcript_23352/g.65121  ORF Transcript_23352/g.65121 Transcript_23352/m.65121 type:complete len:150 (+) Transcript_23352:99-548(+)
MCALAAPPQMISNCVELDAAVCEARLRSGEATFAGLRAQVAQDRNELGELEERLRRMAERKRDALGRFSETRRKMRELHSKLDMVDQAVAAPPSVDVAVPLQPVRLAHGLKERATALREPRGAYTSRKQIAASLATSRGELIVPSRDGY